MNSKIKSTLKIILAVSVIGIILVNPIFAATGDLTVSFPSGSGKVDNTTQTAVKKVWTTVTLVVQILSFGAILFAGLRYMFTSADERADIKKGMTMLVIGSVLVFSSATVVKYFVSVGKEVLNIE